MLGWWIPTDQLTLAVDFFAFESRFQVFKTWPSCSIVIGFFWGTQMTISCLRLSIQNSSQPGPTLQRSFHIRNLHIETQLKTCRWIFTQRDQLHSTSLHMFVHILSYVWPLTQKNRVLEMILESQWGEKWSFGNDGITKKRLDLNSEMLIFSLSMGYL